MISPAAMARGLAAEDKRLRRSPASAVENNLRGKRRKRQANRTTTQISGTGDHGAAVVNNSPQFMSNMQEEMYVYVCTVALLSVVGFALTEARNRRPFRRS